MARSLYRLQSNVTAVRKPPHCPSHGMWRGTMTSCVKKSKNNYTHAGQDDDDNDEKQNANADGIHFLN